MITLVAHSLAFAPGARLLRSRPARAADPAYILTAAREMRLLLHRFTGG